MKDVSVVTGINRLETSEIKELKETIQRKTEDLKFSIVKINEKIIVAKYYLNELEEAAEDNDKVLGFVDYKKSIMGKIEDHLNKIKSLL